MSLKHPTNRTNELLSNPKTFRLIVIAAVAVQVVGSILIARHKLLWHDELLTFYFAGLPTFRDVYAALLQSIERSTPFFYFITRILMAILGSDSMSIRIPAIVAVAMLSLCVYRFIERRTSPTIGLIGMLFLLVTEVFFFSFEGRAYGMMVGFNALSLVAWQSAAEDRAKTLPILLLGFSSFATAASHYYGIFGLVPIGIGEMIRSYTNRRIHVPIWLALCCGLLPLILMIPLIQAGGSLVLDFWPPLKWTTPIEFFRFMLEPALLPLVAVLVLLSVDSLLPKHSTVRKAIKIPASELAVAFSFLLLPFLMLFVGKLFVGVFTERYASATVIGLTILFSFALSRSIAEERFLGLLVIVFLGGWLLFQIFNERNNAIREAADQQRTFQFISSHNQDGLPVIVSNAQLFLSLSHYAPKETSRHLLYLSNVTAASRMIGTGSVERILLELKDRVPLNIQDYSSYLTTQRRFLLYWKRGRLDWMFRKLVEDGVALSLVAERDREFLFLAYFSASAGKVPTD